MGRHYSKFINMYYNLTYDFFFFLTKYLINNHDELKNNKTKKIVNMMNHRNVSNKYEL